MPGDNRTPTPRSGPARRVASTDLTAAMVPGPLDPHDDASWEAVARFAHSHNGYARGGGPARLGPIVEAMRARWQQDGHLPSEVADLRDALFLWHRRQRHGGQDPSDDDVAWLNALLDGIRSAVPPS